MQLDPITVAQENILSAWDLRQAASKNENKFILMASTIGATNPANFVQATLRLAEYYLLHGHALSGGKTAVARLLNLLENRGFVLNRVEKQLREGRNVVLNHPEETRYFFSADSAAKFILLSVSIAMADKGGKTAIYMPSLNGKARVLDLTRLIIRDYGLDPDKDVKIKYIYSEDVTAWKDEVQLEENSIHETAYTNIKRIVPSSYSLDTPISEDIERIRELVSKEDREGLIRLVESRIRQLTGKECSLLDVRVGGF